jgi:hypothetical protein
VSAWRTLWCAVYISALWPGLAWAEQAVRAAPYIVHYAAIRTTDLTPVVARQFDVQRSGRQALLVLNVQRDTGAALPEPVPATASGHVTSLLGHRQRLALRPHQEAGVHYVLATFETLTAEYLTLDLQVTPEGAEAPIAVKFQQQFFNE